MVVELDEESLQQLARRLLGQCLFGEPLLVEWQQVLVEVARIEGVPAVEFRDHRQVAEPVVLQGLVKVARGVGGDVPADVGDFFEISLAPGSGSPAASSAARCAWRSANTITAFAGNVHGAERFALRIALRVVEKIEAADRLGDLALEIEHPFAVDLAVEHRMARRAAP